MVVRTDTCVFSEHKIYPGRGGRYVSKDGKTHFFLTKKSRKLFLSKVKAQKIRWTTAWRRLNKKIKTDEISKKKKKRAIRVQKAIVGISLEEIKRKRNEDDKIRSAAKEQAMREIKERRLKEIDSKKKSNKANFKDQGKKATSGKTGKQTGKK
jgi:large subunit ribosomal protein L24e